MAVALGPGVGTPVGPGVGVGLGCCVGPGVGWMQGVGAGLPKGSGVANGSKDVPGSQIGGGSGAQTSVGAKAPPQVLPKGANELM